MCNVAELKKAKQRIKELESELAPPPPPVDRREISSAELTQILSEKFLIPSSDIFMSDINRHLCDIEDVAIFLEQDMTNHLNYVREDFDCDDFTYILMGQFSVPTWSRFAKGILWIVASHALLCFVDANLDVWTIEPQNDVYSKLEEPVSARIIMM